MTPEEAQKLRAEFPAAAIGYVPKGGVQLAYVGHAATTDRLLQVDPDWKWEPMSFDEHGLPALDAEGNLWIWLTVCGVTRPGVGDGKNAKERIGDAIRNAAMRFGVALDLWAKEDLHAQNGNGPAPAQTDDIPFGDSTPSIPEDDPGALSPKAPQSSSDLKPTAGQRKKLGILVKTLRDERGVITTENLWAALANSRNVDVTVMIDLYEGSYDEHGVLHFGPLLASLTRGEASNLIDRLERLEQHTSGQSA